MWEGENILSFSMAGEPRGKGRPRFSQKHGFVQTFTDSATRKYEASISEIAREAMRGRPPFTGPVGVSMRFRMPVPKSITKAVRAGMLAGEIAPAVSPDIDNLVKAVLDAMAVDAAVLARIRKTARAARELDLPAPDKSPARIVFVNDWQITRLVVSKIYAAAPGVDVRVEAFAPQGPAP
jgi:Holliday junction resolvase RusA-like endonuclease